MIRANRAPAVTVYVTVVPACVHARTYIYLPGSSSISGMAGRSLVLLRAGRKDSHPTCCKAVQDTLRLTIPIWECFSFLWSPSDRSIDVASHKHGKCGGWKGTDVLLACLHMCRVGEAGRDVQASYPHLSRVLDSTHPKSSAPLGIALAHQGPNLRLEHDASASPSFRGPEGDHFHAFLFFRVPAYISTGNLLECPQCRLRRRILGRGRLQGCENSVVENPSHIPRSTLYHCGKRRGFLTQRVVQCTVVFGSAPGVFKGFPHHLQTELHLAR